MATKKNQKTQKKNQSRTKASGSNKREPEKKSKSNQKPAMKDRSPFQDEIILVVTLMVSILFILSNFNLAGPAGQFVNHFIFGALGVLAYIVPYLLFMGEAFYISNRDNKEAVRKLIYIILLFIVLTGLLQMVTGDYSEKELLKYYHNSAETNAGGGIVGGFLCKYLVSNFGEAGTYVILVTLVVIFLILTTEKLIFAGLKRRGNQAVISMRDKHQEQENEVQTEESSERKAKTFTFQKTPRNMESPIKEGLPISKNEDKQIYEQELYNKFNGSKDYDISDLADKQLSGEGSKITPEPVSQGISLQEEPVKVIPAKSEENNNATEKVSALAKNKREKKEEIKKEEIMKPAPQVVSEDGYVFPPTDLLSGPKNSAKGMSDNELNETAMKLQSTLESFGVRVTIINVSCGPSVTRYELQPEQGVKVSRITNLSDDIKLNLAAADIRIEAPIPGKAAVGIEVPNKVNSIVTFRELIESKEFQSHSSNVAFAVGKDIGGQTIVTDIAKMPHLLIAGATGSGKSVCINTLIMSILYKANPNDVKLIMVDPKVVELSVYNGIPHLLIPVVTDPKKASAALNWAVMEMTDRYNKFAELGVRDIRGYNKKVSKVADANDEKYKKMPQIVIIVDELADLMMVAPGEVEDAICRLAQMARAAGLHLIIATQRPSVNVITGLIKANVPSRIAFSVSSAIDSRTIIDGSGAEKLLGKGDMLFFPSGYPKPVRVQGAFISDKEVSEVVEFLSEQNSQPQYEEEIANKINSVQMQDSTTGAVSSRDDYFVEAGRFIIEKDKASIGMLQRVYKIGFNRAARIMDQLCEAGVVGPEEGTKPRKVIMSMEEFEQFVDEYV